MYKIVFKGQIPDELVETVEGLGLASAWESGKLPAKVKINNNLYESSSIKAVISGFENPEKNDATKDIAAMWSGFNDWANKAASLSPEQKAENTELAELTYVAMAGVQMPPELRPNIIARQLAFFKENPNYVYAKPTCYRDLLPPPMRPKEYHISNFTALSGLHLVERILQNGIR